MRLGVLPYILLLFACFQQASYAQFQYRYDLDIPVSTTTSVLTEPWVGGIDVGQYNAVHLNEDDILDLVIFDRHNNKVLTYIGDGENYTYSPWLEHLLPVGLKSWVLFRDFNCDGKQDIFTSSLFGMSLYENTSSGSGLSWDLLYSTIFTEGSNGQVNIQVNSGDLPSISDIDGDGDLDILVFDFAIGGGVNLHKNMSVERTGTCDMDLVFETDRYGDFAECTCETYVFGSEDCPESGRIEHSGGKSIVSYSYEGGTSQDLLIGQEDCALYGYLKNDGTINTPSMTNVSFNFPDEAVPITLNYPAAYNIDLDFDGIEDLLVTHNAFSDLGEPDYANNNLFYKKSVSGYTLQSASFMQDRMIDLGYGASPAFSDIDGDGDEEMFVGAGTYRSGAKLHFFDNVGDAISPQLVLQNSNYLDLETENHEFIRPQFIDLNKNGFKDLVVILSKSTASESRVYWHSTNPLVPYSISNATTFSTPNLNLYDSPFFYFNNGQLSILIGRTAGNLAQYINRATLENPQWELISDSFLGITEDFMARNLSLAIDDLNQDGKNDLITYDDSGILQIYSNFITASEPISNILTDTVTLEKYNSSFGSSVRIATTRVAGTLSPSIALGLRTGGIQILRNLNDDQLNIEVPIRLATFPNPVKSNGQIQLVANKSVSFKIIDTTGHTVSNSIDLPKGDKLTLDITALKAGLYLIQAVDESGKKATSKIVITN